MNKLFQKILATAVFIMLFASAQAQGAQQTDDVMRSNGKIYVVVAVCLTILIGLFLYVLSIDRKLSRLEKENKTV